MNCIQILLLAYEFQYVARMVVVGESSDEAPVLCCTQQLLFSLERSNDQHQDSSYYIDRFIESLDALRDELMMDENELNDEDLNSIAELIAALQSFKQSPLLATSESEMGDGFQLIQLLIQTLKDMLDDDSSNDASDTSAQIEDPVDVVDDVI